MSFRGQLHNKCGHAIIFGYFDNLIYIPVKWYYKFSYNPIYQMHLQLLSRNFLPMESTM